LSSSGFGRVRRGSFSYGRLRLRVAASPFIKDCEAAGTADDPLSRYNRYRAA